MLSFYILLYPSLSVIDICKTSIDKLLFYHIGIQIFD